MHDIRYDAVNDEILVTNPFAKAIMAFRGDADGEAAPIRIIQGPKTQLGSNTDHLDVDPVHNEIFIPARDSILVFRRDAQGDVAPIRVIQGPDTQLSGVLGVAVDPVNDVLVAGIVASSQFGYGDGSGMGAILVFNRTDNGNVKPKRVIRGPQTGLIIPEQLQVYPPRGLIFVAQSTDWNIRFPEGTYLGIWSINDEGDVPARWKIAGPKSTITRPRGVAINPKHKEIMVADMSLNSVATFYFPEVF